jgi:hypothetical protein
MKIADFKRNEANQIVAVGEDGAEVVLSFEYVAANKPQVGDEYIAVETVAEVEAIVEAAPEVAEPAAE